ncbi:hypothetical protein FOZ60_012635 [Perkinsus olseni]|uniref:Uncharacterized protein n=1 Tax=Perkinsus olseni TaxID=32597 RepID=A0A7J6NB28_PEROL|nr:hypothetical protein FOZ60_012635 [Perkinsus olseni]
MGCTCVSPAQRTLQGYIRDLLHNDSSSDSRSDQAMDITIILTDGAEHFESQRQQRCGIALGNSIQARMLTGKRTLYFYAAIEADKDPASAPTFLYFEGGPGGSSVAAALQLNGPCIRDFVTRRLRLNLAVPCVAFLPSETYLESYSWTAQANGVDRCAGSYRLPV